MNTQISNPLIPTKRCSFSDILMKVEHSTSWWDFFCFRHNVQEYFWIFHTIKPFTFFLQNVKNEQKAYIFLFFYFYNYFVITQEISKTIKVVKNKAASNKILIAETVVFCLETYSSGNFPEFFHAHLCIFKLFCFSIYGTFVTCLN